MLVCSVPMRHAARFENPLKTIHMVKKRILWMVAAIMIAITVQAQGFAGRIYQNPNIYSGEIEAKVKKDIAKTEKKKGRKLTDEERAKLTERIRLVRGSIKTQATAQFVSDTQMTLKISTTFDEESLKKADVGWAKRKTLKAAASASPSLTVKYNYTVQGNLVIARDGSDIDTLRLSADGRQLSATYDKNTKFTMTRTK